MSKESIKQNEPFLQRVIEHWLDSANELTYQPLFCELLLFEGYAVKYEIKNTNFEQGKDVVAIAPNGTPSAYQLKGGKITLNRWRSEVKPEIESLIETPIVHPSIPKDKGHVSYLVTNGDIDDSVRLEIDALNSKKWRESPLMVITIGDLLQGFQKIAGEVLPQDAYAYKTLANLIFANGTDFVDLSEIYPFLYQILSVDIEERAKEQRKRDISAAMLYTTMIAGPYREKENHTSVVRVMVLLASLILHLADRYGLEDRYWFESYKLVWEDILGSAKNLESEIEDRGFDTSFNDILDKFSLPENRLTLVPFRKNSATSVILALKLSQVVGNNRLKSENVLSKEMVSTYKGILIPFGEAGLLPFILLASLLLYSNEEREEGVDLMKRAINSIIQYSGRKANDPTGMLQPHFDLNFIVNMIFQVSQEPFEYQNKSYSHYLKPSIEIMVRLNQRKYVSDMWKEISFMHFEEFVFDHNYDYYLMQARTGENRTMLPKREKSWGELVNEANSFKGDTLPDSIKRFPEFIPFFLAVFPYRLNSDVVGFLFQKLGKNTVRD